YPRTGQASLVGSVEGTLQGKNQLPLAFKAPRADVALDEAAARAPRKKAAKGELSERVFASLRRFRRVSSEGGVHATWKEQTFDGDALDYDGHTAVLRGAPLKVHDGATHMDYETRRLTVDLDGA